MVHRPWLLTIRTSLRPSSLATLVTLLNSLIVLGCCGSVKSMRRTDSVGRPVLETGAAVAAGLGSSQWTKTIAKTDPDAGNSTLPPGGSRRTFRSASTGSPGFVMSTMAKAFLSVRSTPQEIAEREGTELRNRERIQTARVRRLRKHTDFSY